MFIINDSVEVEGLVASHNYVDAPKNELFDQLHHWNYNSINNDQQSQSTTESSQITWQRHVRANWSVKTRNITKFYDLPLISLCDEDIKIQGNRAWGHGWIDLAQDSAVAGSCEHSNESLDYTEGGEFLDMWALASQEEFFSLLLVTLRRCMKCWQWYMGWSFNSRTDFFVREWVDLTASWSCLLRSSVLILVCTYSSVPATDESTSGSTFCNSRQLSRRIGLNLFHVIKSATFHCFLQLREREEVARSKVRGVGRVWEQRNVVFRQKFTCGDSPVGRGIVMVQEPINGAPLLRAMSAHSVAEALQDGSVEFLTYRPSSRNVLMTNQPVNVEERNQHGLDIGLHLLRFLWSRRWCRVPLGWHLLCFRVIPVNPAFVTSDYRGHEVRIVLGSLTEVSANWHAIILLLRRQETGHKFRWQTSHLQIFIQNFLARTECYSSILCILWYSDVGQSEWFLAHVPRSPRCGRWTAFLGGGRLQRIGVHFLNGNTTQMSSIDLGRSLRKLLAAFRTFQHQFSSDGNRNWCTHAAELSPQSWDATHTAGRRSLRGFHRANAGRHRLPVMQVHLHRVATYPALLPLHCVL